MQNKQTIEVHSDSGRVRIGAQTPSLPVRTSDSGKVRLGAQTPSLPARTSELATWPSKSRIRHAPR